MTEKSVFTGREQAQILTSLVQLANQCPGLPCEVYLDTLSEKAPAMCLGTMTGGSKVYNVVGGYTAELPFTINLKIAERFTLKRINAVEVLGKLGAFFEQRKQQNALPDLGDRDVCLDIRMETNPYLFDTEESGGKAHYQAQCVLVYKHKSDYE